MEGSMQPWRSSAKTYSRKSSHIVAAPSAQKAQVEESITVAMELPLNKRSRISIADYFKPANTSSSPLPSEAEHLHSTPPSSPPPQTTSPNIHPRKKRRLTTRMSLPLISTTDNPSLRTSRPMTSVSGPAAAPPSATTMVQRQLASTQITCPQCKMTYDRALPTEIRMHRKHHQETTNWEAQVKAPAHGTVLWSSTTPEAGLPVTIRAMDRDCKLAWRKPYEQALAHINDRGLSAAPIPPTELWSAVTEPADASQRPAHTGGLVPKYRFFIQTTGARLDGLLLAKTATAAGVYASAESGSGVAGPRFIAHDGARSCALSVDLLWVASAQRRRGVATRLLDMARTHFLPGRKLRREEICFSVPTAEGEMFARTYCGVRAEAREKAAVWVNLEEPGPYIKEGTLYSGG